MTAFTFTVIILISYCFAPIVQQYALIRQIFSAKYPFTLLSFPVLQYNISSNRFLSEKHRFKTL